jgi:two-component system, OmpR family, response regulator QseB
MTQTQATALIMPTGRILLVEDNLDLRGLLQQILFAAGHEVIAVADGRAGLDECLSDHFDVLVIDRGLPALDGLDLIRRIRGLGILTPVMILTAYGSAADRLAGLAAGAEDYVVKPFDIDELLSRIEALLRRGSPLSDSVRIGDVLVDFAGRHAHRGDGTDVDLSGQECALLRLLCVHGGRIVDRQELHRHLFGQTDTAVTVDVCVRQLRRKLGEDIVTTIDGRGYRLEVR